MGEGPGRIVPGPPAPDGGARREPGVSGRRGGPELAERLEAEGYTGVLAEAGVSVGLPTGVTHPGGHEAGFGEDPLADPLDR